VKVVNKTIFAGFVALMLVSKITCANAQQFGTAEEARAMLNRAISALKTDEDEALTEFNDPDNKQFHDRDLYVVCFNMSDGKITAYLGPALLGVDIRTLSLNDDPIGQRTYDAILVRTARLRRGRHVRTSLF
jgi:cytochrome c